MSARQSDPKPPPEHDLLFAEGHAMPGRHIGRKRCRSKRSVVGVVGSSSSTAAAVQHATAAAGHATENNLEAGDESSRGAQDFNRKPKGESYTVGVLREFLQKEEIRLKLMDNRARFISAVILGELCITGRSTADIVAELEYACYDKLPVHGDGLEEALRGHVKSAQQGTKEETISYDYLLDMPISWLSIEKLQDLQEEADIQAALDARTRAALAPELSEPEAEAAIAECHAEIARQAATQQKCVAGWRVGSLQEYGKVEKRKGMMDPGDYEDEPLPGVPKGNEGLGAAAELEEEEPPIWTGLPPELLVMSPCCLQRWGRGGYCHSRLVLCCVTNKCRCFSPLQLCPRPSSTRTRWTPSCSWWPPHQIIHRPRYTPSLPHRHSLTGRMTLLGQYPPALPPLQPGPSQPPQQQSTHFFAPFGPPAPPPYWPPQPPRPFMAGTPAPVPWPPQPPGPVTAGTRGFVPPPRPPPHEPPRPPPRPPLQAPPQPPPHDPSPQQPQG